MNTMRSKSVFVHGKIKRGLQSGRYRPGQRLDPATLADEFHTSLTPVRSALDRLVAEGMLDDQARAGLYVPLPTEAALRELYGWMQRLLLIACDLAIASPGEASATPLDIASPDADLVKLLWQLFDAIGRAADDRYLHRAIKRANNQLAPIRRAKSGLIENAREELFELHRHWQDGNMPALASTVTAFHQRRQEIVPRIVDLLRERNGHLH